MAKLPQNSVLPLLRSVLAVGITVLATGVAHDAAAADLAVGPGLTYSTPCRAFAAAAPGDTVSIAGNTTYRGDVCGIYQNNLTIRGVNGRPQIDAAGNNAMGKGIWVVIGNNITIDNVEMFGARVADMNGAALRLEGTNFTLLRSFLHDNENGILAGYNAASNIRIERSEFGHNGAGDGRSHNLYIGNVHNLVFRFNYSHDAVVGHNLKSRAANNNISYNRFSSLAPGQTGSTAAGQPSYEIDLPNAGTSYVIGNIIEQPAANQNPAMLAYGAEGASNPGQDLYVINNTFLNDDTARGTFVAVGPSVTVPVVMRNNIFAGTGTDVTQANALQFNNYRSIAPGFVDRARFDLHPIANALVINAGSEPGVLPNGMPLRPTAQYVHPASGQLRPLDSALDVGAFEAALPR